MLRFILAALLAVSLTGCNDVEIATTSTVHLAPRLIEDIYCDSIPPGGTHDQGYDDASLFLLTFEEHNQFPFGGDGSIVMFLTTFEIPCVWSTGKQPVSDWDWENRPAGALSLATEPDYDSMTPYQQGAMDALRKY